MKKLILALCGFGVLTMLFTSINFYIEQNKHKHPASGSPQTASNEMKKAFNPNQGQSKSLAPDTMLPENIPPAMLEAMEKQGITLEDLQKNNPDGMQNMKNMPDMQGMKGMKGKEFPEEMLKAMQEQNKMQKNNKSGGQQNAPLQKAVEHIKSHGEQNMIKHLEHSLATLEANPGDETALSDVTEIFIAHEETEAAEHLLKQGIMTAPNSAVLPYLYGQALAHNSRYAQAAEQWERALSLQESAEVHYSLGMLYRYQLNKENDAKKHFQKSSGLPAHDPRLAEHLKIELTK